MELSVREARAQFATALAAAERGERVTITKNGKAVAELGPPTVKKGGLDLARIQRWREENGFERGDTELDDAWRKQFDDPAWTREIFGPDYFDDEDATDRR
ncbi:type II toxin-antitoxin system prevent-host-death family antitoxin [Sphingomonas sp. Tas61C01]|uniref:type II toxin-antitoxin system prevent-host-death family antitoxin n=1 Tax=Sphingomonas sp. Tas61C01 TaxID=3458297 RepID=UPI00403E786C